MPTNQKELDMYAVRHPAVRNLWFDFDACTWSLDPSKRSTFLAESEAREWASLPQDGGIVIKVA